VTTITAYSGFDEERLKDDFGLGLGFDPPTNVSTSQFTEKAAGFFGDQLVFLGNFSVSGGNITGGTITGLDLVNSYGAKVAVVSGINIAVTSTGYSFSFNYGPFISPGITYRDAGFDDYLNGYGNDTYYTAGGTHVDPGGGVNTIYGTDSSTTVFFSGSSNQYSFALGNNGSVWVIDSTTTRNGYNNIYGSATLQFDDGVQVTDNAGQMILWESAVVAAGQQASFGSAVTVNVSDTASAVSANLDAINTNILSGAVTWIALTDSGTPTLSVTETQLTSDAAAIKAIYTSYVLAVTNVAVADASSVLAATNVASISISDTLAHVTSGLDSLESMISKIGSILLTDSGTPNLTVTAAQFAADATALNDITSAHAVTVQMTGNAAQHNFTGENWTGASALQFADQTVIVAATPGGANAVTTGNVTELYSAVLAREPDVSGLAFYQNFLKSNPTTSLQTFAEFFLNSTEYTSAHSYAQTTAGETQFITDSYQNLLHRTPSADEVNFYLTNVLEKPGTQLQNHALMLVYFSASTEFLGDVQITAANPASAAHWLFLS